MKNKTLMEALEEAGYPREQMFHHDSDLYIYVTPLTREITDAWFKENGLHKKLFVSTFTDQITGKQMYDIFFQYTPYFENPSA